MKKLLTVLLLFWPALVLADFDDDESERALYKERTQHLEGREAMREKKDTSEIDYDLVTRKAAEARRKQKEREAYLVQNFETVLIPELARARRFYDTATVQFFETIARDRYQKDPSLRFNRYAMARIYQFHCEVLVYRYNTTHLMFEKPRLLKQREEMSLKGLIPVEKLLAETPNDAELWRMKGFFLAGLRDKKISHTNYADQARQAFEKALSLSEDPVLAKLALAQFYFNLPSKKGRKVEEALALAKELASNKACEVDACLILGRAAQEKYDYDTSFREFKTAIMIEPKNPEVDYYYAQARRDKKRFKKLMSSP